MVLKNPTNENLTIKFLGVEYSIGAFQSKEIPDECAEYWRTKLHRFLEIGVAEVAQTAAPIVKKDVVEEKKEVVEIKEEKKEEVVEVKEEKKEVKVEVKAKK